MDGRTERTAPAPRQPEIVIVELGGLVALTEGQGKGSSEDKRRAYNCA